MIDKRIYAICMDQIDRAGSLKLTAEEFEQRVIDELEVISKLPGGEQIYLDMRKFKTALKEKFDAHDGYVGFRGTTGYGLVPYLLGITDYYDTSTGYQWAFNAGLSKKNPRFFVNVAPAMITGLPQCGIPDILQIITIFPLKDVGVLKVLQPDGTIANYSDYLSNPGLYDSYVHEFFTSKSLEEIKECCEYLSDLRSDFAYCADEVIEYLGKNDRLPDNFVQLVKLIGFVHSNYWDDNAFGYTSHKDYLERRRTDLHVKQLRKLLKATDSRESFYEQLISSPEDVYEKLVAEGCPELTAGKMARKLARIKLHFNATELSNIAYYCGADYCLAADRIQHLFYRVQTNDSAMITCQIMHHMCNDVGMAAVKRSYDEN